MPLDDVVDTLDAVPEAYRTLYVERDGKFVLDTKRIDDTVGLKSTLETERNTRKEVERQMKDLQKKFEGLNPDQIRNMLKRVENDEEARLMAEGKFEEVLSKRVSRQTEALQADYKKQLEDKDKELEKRNHVMTKLQRRALDSILTKTALDVGVNKEPGTLEDALLNALHEGWTIDEDGEAVRMRDGEVMLGKDGKTPQKLTEWFANKRETKKHWFPAGNAGGGANGSGRGSNEDLSGLPAVDRLTAARARKSTART